MKSTMTLRFICLTVLLCGCERTPHSSDSDQVDFPAGDETAVTPSGGIMPADDPSDAVGVVEAEVSPFDAASAAETEASPGDTASAVVTDVGWHLGHLPENQVTPDCHTEVQGPESMSDLARKASGIDFDPDL